jgi:hypothetical protein
MNSYRDRSLLIIVVFVVLIWTIFRYLPRSPGEPGATDRALGSAHDAPRFDGKRNADLRLVLPPRFEQALAAEGPDFATLGFADFVPEVARAKTGWNTPYSARQTPFAVVTDFDGDEKRDVALIQRSSTHGRAVAVLDGATPRVVELRRWAWNTGGSGGRTPFHLVAAPGSHTRPRGGRGPDANERIVTGGVQLVYPGMGTVTYFLEEDGRFRPSTRGF